MSELSPPSAYVSACRLAFTAWREAPEEGKAEAWRRFQAVLAGQQTPLPADWQRKAANDEEEL